MPRSGQKLNKIRLKYFFLLPKTLYILRLNFLKNIFRYNFFNKRWKRNPLYNICYWPNIARLNIFSKPGLMRVSRLVSIHLNFNSKTGLWSIGFSILDELRFYKKRLIRVKGKKPGTIFTTILLLTNQADTVLIKQATLTWVPCLFSYPPYNTSREFRNIKILIRGVVS